MVKNFWKKANSFLLASAMAMSLMPAQMVSAAEPSGAAAYTMGLKDITDKDVTDKDVTAKDITVKDCTVIQGNAPVLPKEVNLTPDDETAAPTEIQWAQWDEDAEAGDHTVTGTAGGEKVSVTVHVLPCDEAVEDVQAMGKSDDSTQEKKDAIHPLKGYKGLFVAEYDIVPNDVKATHDRAVIYLPATVANEEGVEEEPTAENCWDSGARLQFKYNHDGVFYFQTQNGDGKVVNNAKYYPTSEELDAALENGGEAPALLFDQTSTYRVRTVMDTASDTEKGNVKIYITDPDGVEHEVTKPGGNGFRIYPKNGVIDHFAAVRGGYRLENHKISWISGYATKKVETYLKAQNAADYVKESGDTVTKVLPGVAAEEPDAEIVKDNQSYTLDTEKSGWYDGDEKVSSVTAAEGDTVTYRAYYNYAKAIDKTQLNEKIQKAESLSGADYTASSWSAFTEALEKASQVSSSAVASQTKVDGAVQALDTAEKNLVNIKSLKEAVDKLKAELTEKESQKGDYANWDEVEKALEDAEKVLKRSNATKSQVEAAEKKLEIKLITKSEVETAAAKEAMESSVAAAEQKIAGIKEADYTPASWKALKDALEACKNLNPDTASKADYDAKKDALDRAVNGLAKLADKTALNQAIASAKAIKEADYEAAGYKAMQEKLSAANAVAANANATQSEVDTAKTALLDAIGKLVQKPTDVKVKSIKPAAKTYKIAAGKKLDLKQVFTVSPSNASNKKLTYSVDKKYSKYASVKSGKVTVKRNGAGRTVVVKATAADGSGVSASIKIKIMKHAVTKIFVKNKSLTVKAGKKVTIKPVVKTNGKSANKTLSYTSSNEKLATVKKGVVSTKKGKTGKVTITVKSTDGTGKSAKVKINIKK